jgi:hypothetical protein
VLPLIATEEPKLSSGLPSAASSLACWVHVVPVRTKMYTAPARSPFSPSW